MVYFKQIFTKGEFMKMDKTMGKICPLSPSQEKEYQLTCAVRILKYSKILFPMIIAFQLYNLLYTLWYTHGNLHSVSSRVYSIFYLFLLLVTLIGCFLRHYLEKKLPAGAKTVLNLQRIYGVLLMGWGMGITIYDQRVSNNVSVFLIMALTIAFLADYTPLQAFLMYASSLFLLCLFLPCFQPTVTDNYGNYVNLTIMTIMSLFVLFQRYYQDRLRFLQQQTIMEQNQALEEFANKDSLTQLHNRRFLQENIHMFYETCVKNDYNFTVMMIDIDNFKLYNDTYGHQQGDECLRRVAWRLKQELNQENEFLIRYGGEEFLYLGIGISEEDAARKAGQFNRVIRNLIIGFSDQDSRSVTISIGLCSRPALSSLSWEKYISDADKAMYTAKQSGKDCFQKS